jgi:hypothetical protein
LGASEEDLTKLATVHYFLPICSFISSVGIHFSSTFSPLNLAFVQPRRGRRRKVAARAPALAQTNNKMDAARAKKAGQNIKSMEQVR